MKQDRVAAKAQSVKRASIELYRSSTAKKNGLLAAIRRQMKNSIPAIVSANKKDLAAAKAAGITDVLLDRLLLNEKRIRQMMHGIDDVIALPDPVGEQLKSVRRPNGLTIRQMRVPLGAIGIIYEARPNVTVDASVLCLKAGNAVLLKGGSEALHTNRKLVDLIKAALHECAMPSGCVEFIDTADRAAVKSMIKQDAFLDVIIPRGSHQLIRFIQENSSVPVIAHGEGNCHVYVDATADLVMAEEIVYNAKTQRPSVCNATEKLLVHEKQARQFLPRMIARLRGAGVEVRGDAKTRSICPDVIAAQEDDWYREYLNLTIAVKVVRSIDEAIDHINKYGSHHSDAIVAKKKLHEEKFLRMVDSATVYANASTRFTDGFEFGLGAEIGISTQKLHARGPMGLVELTSEKFIVRGNGQIRN